MDLIDACGQSVADLLGCGYAGQEPLDKSEIPTAGLIIVQRIGGGMGLYGTTDSPWISFTVLSRSKKRGWDMLRTIRQHWAKPRAHLGPFFLYRVREVLNPEDATLPSDPFYRVRVGFEFQTRGLA